MEKIENSTHNHGNCELCDYLRKRLEAAETHCETEERDDDYRSTYQAWRKAAGKSSERRVS